MSKKQDNYHDGNLGANFTHKNLMAQPTNDSQPQGQAQAFSQPGEEEEEEEEEG
jgi:hypothetical protein